MKFWIRSLLIFSFLITCRGHAAILVTLRNGAQLRAESKSVTAEIVSLRVGGGEISLPVIEVVSSEEVQEAVPEGPTEQAQQCSPADAISKASIAQALP